MPPSCIAFKAMASSRAIGTMYFSSSLLLVARIYHISGFSPFQQQKHEGRKQIVFLDKRKSCQHTNVRTLPPGQYSLTIQSWTHQKWYWHFWRGRPWAASRPWSRVEWPQCSHPSPAHWFCSHRSRHRWLWGQRHDCWLDQSWKVKRFEMEILIRD